MNDALPRCTVPGSTCRLLQFDAVGARPVWAVLDGAGARRFTGEVTLHLEPGVRAYFHDGEIYFAERDTDPSLSSRLVDCGVMTSDELERGTVRLGTVAHLGKLFDRVPSIDRDQVELALELLTGELLGEIADHTVSGTTVASYRHHPSGVHKWLRKVTVIAPIVEPVVDATGPVAVVETVVEPIVEPVVVVADPEPTEFDRAVIAEFEQLQRATAVDTTVTAQIPVVTDAPAPAFAPPAAAEAPTGPVAPETPAAPGTITERIWYRDPVLDPTSGQVPTVTAAPSVTPAPASAPAPVPGPTVAETTARPVLPPRDTPIAFDLASVIAAVARENAGQPVPLDDESEVDDSVRAAVREALAEIEAATRPKVTDTLSPMAFERALDIGGGASASAPVRDPAHGDLTIIGSEDLPDDHVEDHAGAETSGVGLRRLIGGGRKP